MSAYWETEILTTCAIDYVTWENSYPPGDETIGDTLVRRFPVAAARVTADFNQLSARIYETRGTASAEEEAAWMKAQGPWCPALVQYIESHSSEYDVFIFFTYLYWPTLMALPIVASRAILVPLAHDEWTIHLSIFRQLFTNVRHYIFNTIEEKHLLQRLFPDSRIEGPVIGVGVDRPLDLDPLRFRREHQIDDGFLLYVGRIDPSKGCDELFEFFIRGRGECRLPSKLVLLGKPVMPVPAHPDIITLGFVSEQTKWDGLAACDAMVMPSVNESLSMVLLEAWSVGKPVMVNGRCDVLVGQCRRSNGGLWYSNYEEWSRVIARLQSGSVAGVLGRQGWRFVGENYSWPAIERAYVDRVEAIFGAMRR
jgi:glycosyltransferase involved in cell wall biosynthesis